MRGAFRVRLLPRHRALDLGMTLFDTADMYDVGYNEELVGGVARERREGVIVATKFGKVRGEDGSPDSINGRSDYLRARRDGLLPPRVRRPGRATLRHRWQHSICKRRLAATDPWHKRSKT